MKIVPQLWSFENSNNTKAIILKSPITSGRLYHASFAATKNVKVTKSWIFLPDFNGRLNRPNNMWQGLRQDMTLFTRDTIQTLESQKCQKSIKYKPQQVKGKTQSWPKEEVMWTAMSHAMRTGLLQPTEHAYHIITSTSLLVDMNLQDLTFALWFPCSHSSLFFLCPFCCNKKAYSALLYVTSI